MKMVMLVLWIKIKPERERRLLKVMTLLIDNRIAELYKLTLIEEERYLTDEETRRYLDIVEYCEVNEIEIDFGINI
jgi:hypothetical protein